MRYNMTLTADNFAPNCTVAQAVASLNLSRSASRSLAFQILYSFSFTPPQTTRELEHNFLKACAMHEPSLKQAPKPKKAVAKKNFASENELGAEVAFIVAATEASVEEPACDLFVWDLVYGVWSNKDRLDAAISEYSRHWKVGRLGRVEHTLLRMGVFELQYSKDVPQKVVISEAVELARQFADQKALAFINGILDSLSKAD